MPATPDVATLVEDYKGREVQSAGESFDVSPQAIEARVQRPEPIEGVKIAFLPKKTRGESVYRAPEPALRHGREPQGQGRRPPASSPGSCSGARST